MRYSVDTYLLPQINDKWALYVARSLKKMLVHLERRIESEGELLVEDSRELQALLIEIRDGGSTGLPADVAEHIAELEPAYEREFVSVKDLSDDNEQLRELLDGIIRSLPPSEDFDPIRTKVRHYLRRQMARDGYLAEPAVISFAPKSAK
jgi:hypothetical protein